MHDYRPKTASPQDLEDPDFFCWVRSQSGGGTGEPDPEDYDQPAAAETEAEIYRLAQARKLMRLWGQWKASRS
jgi:hypothetical protein